MKELSFWKTCAQAVDMTVANDTIFGGFDMEKCMENLLNITTPEEWSKDYLFKGLAKYYMGIYANIIGYRVGIKGTGVFFHEDTKHEGVIGGMVLNEERLSKAYEAKLADLKEKKIKVIAGKDVMDRQLAISGNPEEMNLFEERTLEWLVNLIKAAEKTE